ncbi:unnamed protein product [Polarella glacialis]|uniref:Uncharacterized protein n=1 Tax=Polarella glacialis TaxID=89957 RepID=A0A813GZG4_POLGL|nr:unnamed protein product [Polarella glacialis]
MYEELGIKDAIQNKGGPDLFRELLRQYPLAELEDYYKNGVWQLEMLKLDIEILDAHRAEAGAPYVIPLDEVKMPATMPATSQPMNQAQVMANMMRALGSSGAVLNGTAAVPLSAAQIAVSAQALAARLPGAALAAAAPVAVGATGVPAPLDMRTIALWVSKWKLEPVKTKALLEKLTPPRRRFIMQNFKFVAENGSLPVVKLEEYIRECEKTSSWDAVSGEAAAPVAVAAVESTGVKRTLEQSDESNKRPAASKAASAAKTAAAKAAANGK